MLRAALVVLLAFGAAAAMSWADGGNPWRLRVSPRGAFWQLTDDDGAVTSLRRRGAGLPLAPGQRFTVQAEALGGAPDAITVLAVRPGEPCALQVELPLSDGATALARVAPAEPYALAVLRREVDGAERTLAATVAAIPAPGSPEARTPQGVFAALSEYVGFEWRLALRDSRLSVSLLGVPLLETDLGAAVDGPPRLAALDGPITLRGITLQSGGARPRVLREDFAQLQHPGALARAWHHGRLPLLTLLLALGTLRALCRRPPGALPLLDATAMALAPLAAVFVGHQAVGLRHVTWLATGALFLGALPALRRLDAAGALEPGETPRRSARPMVVAGMVALLALLLVADRRLLRLAPLLEAEARAVAAPLPQAPTPVTHATLDAAGALHLPGPFRDFDLDAEVTLGTGAILELRVRAPDADAARGHALFVPAADVPGPPSLTAAGTRWVWEEVGLIAPLGGPGPRPEPGEPIALHVEARGRSLSAWLGDRSPIVRVGAPAKAPKPVARMGSLREPAGDVLLLAARGALTLDDVMLQPFAAALPPDPKPAAWRTSALPLLAVLGMALVAAHLLGFGAARAAETQALALGPLVIALLATADDGGVPEDALLVASLLGLLIAVLPVVRSPASRRRRLGFVLLAALSLPASFAVATERSLPMDGRTINDLPYTAVHAEPLAADRLHLEHPLLRRWNGWLADHAFKGRRVALRPPVGTRRVIVLGGSSTWGYHLPESARLDWPARVERLLAAAPSTDAAPGATAVPAASGASGEATPVEGTAASAAAAPVGATPSADAAPVEVLNAAWPAATGSRIAPFLEHVLLDFAPDVVVVCLGYNDSFALARPDESAWFLRRLAEGTPWSAWARAADMAVERAARDRFLRALVAADDGAPRPDLGMSRDGSPPAAFATLLEHIADLCASRDAALVLVIESVSPDRQVMWSEALAEAMRDVASRRGLTLVDPRASVAERGGAELFMDVVHPTVDGHAVIAEAVAPVLARVLRDDA